MRSFKSLNTKEKMEYIGIMAIYPLILLFEQMGKSVKFLNSKSRQITASILTVCLMLTMIPVMSLTAFAETTNSQLPDTTMFATKDQLMTFNTDDTDGTTGSAKVYFGSNNQKWWIAGTQNADSIVLFAASPLESSMMFENDSADKTYDPSWGCNYVEIPSDVYANHYGGSDLRALLKKLESSYFSRTEQLFMKETTVFTNDMKNSGTKGFYTTTDKLYAGYGVFGSSSYDKYITVGTVEYNNLPDLNSGLKVDMNYWGNSNFWLRAPVVNYSNYAVIALPENFVWNVQVYYLAAVLPAFELGLEDVLFASAAEAATSSLGAEGGNLAVTENEFVLRCTWTGNYATSATISSSKESIVIAYADEDTYLVVQDSNGAWAKKVTDGEVISANTVSTDGINNLTSFDNCKVWLETTDEDRITHAVEAVESPATDLTVTGGAIGTDYTYENGIVTVLTDTALIISGNTSTDRIEVAKDASANITLAGVNIDVSGQEYAAAFKIADNSTGNVTITLADGTTNTLKSGSDCAGLQKNGDFSSDTTKGNLTITGTGTLNATGGSYAAGIGGGYWSTGSNITISGGSVTTNGGESAAGIGGGYCGSGSNITISGGSVTATGGDWGGAGIGGGSDGKGSDITISGGSVTAKGGDWGGAGIGGGYWGSSSNITISGGSVKAIAGSDANTIGGGQYQNAVTPTNGTDNVYLLIIENPNGEKIYIDGKEYTPNKHDTENKVYAYLTGESHTVKVGENTTKYGFDANDNTFKLLITEDDVTINPTSFVYNGSEHNPTVTVTVGGTTLTENTDYTVAYSDNTGAGKGKVTVIGKGSYIGTVTKEFDIKKATPAVPANPTASAINFGKTLVDSTLTDGWVWADSTIVPTVNNSGYTAYYNIADTDNYDWSDIEGYDATNKRIERTVAVDLNVFELKDSVSTVIDTVYEDTVNVNLSDYITVLDENCVASYSTEGELPQGVTLSNGKLIGEYDAGTTQTVKIKVSAENYVSFTFELTFAYNAPTYSVTIPESVTVTNGEGTFTVKAENVVLGDTKKLSVTIQDTDNEAGMYLTSANDEIGYTLSTDSATVDIGDVILSLNGQGMTATSDSAALKLAITDTPKYAEEYKGTITFTIAVEDK